MLIELLHTQGEVEERKTKELRSITEAALSMTKRGIKDTPPPNFQHETMMQ